MDRELLIPYGIDPKGNLTKAADAKRGIEYVCPECGSPLVYRAGESVTHHYAHKANTACTGESILHLTAKALIAQAINEHCASEVGASISMKCACDCCNSDFTLNLPKNVFSSARQEERIGSFICDVVAISADQPKLAIEVLATHAVGDEKASQLSIPWIELKAEDVLANPTLWKPVASQPAKANRINRVHARLFLVNQRHLVVRIGQIPAQIASPFRATTSYSSEAHRFSKVFLYAIHPK